MAGDESVAALAELSKKGGGAKYMQKVDKLQSKLTTFLQESEQILARDQELDRRSGRRGPSNRRFEKQQRDVNARAGTKKSIQKEAIKVVDVFADQCTKDSKENKPEIVRRVGNALNTGALRPIVDIVKGVQEAEKTIKDLEKIVGKKVSTKQGGLEKFGAAIDEKFKDNPDLASQYKVVLADAKEMQGSISKIKQNVIDLASGKTIQANPELTQTRQKLKTSLETLQPLQQQYEKDHPKISIPQSILNVLKKGMKASRQGKASSPAQVAKPRSPGQGQGVG